MCASREEHLIGESRPVPSRRRADGDVDRRLLALVARLYYLDDRDQSAIARVVGTSRSTISRLLTEARRRGIIRISVEDHV
jgi:DNA-binding transcriptional regulator LsrR (DeoR family)